MRALFILVFSVTTMLIIGGGKARSQDRDHQNHFVSQIQEIFNRKTSHKHEFSPSFHQGLTKEYIDDLTDYLNDMEEIVWSNHIVSIIRSFALIGYAFILIYLLSVYKNRLNFQWNKQFPTSEKYILQRVLRL